MPFFIKINELIGWTRHFIEKQHAINGFGQLGDGGMDGTNVSVRILGMASLVVNAVGGGSRVQADRSGLREEMDFAGQPVIIGLNHENRR
jgi:hypothetical protein